MKCSICNKSLGETFLKKIIGTYVKDAKGKKHAVCNECQTKFATKEEMVASIK